MKQLVIALGCAILQCGGAIAAETPWFDGNIGGTATGGNWAALPEDGSVVLQEQEQGKKRYVLDEPENPFVFTATEKKAADAYTNLIVRTTAKFVYAYEDCTPEIPEGQKVAIAACSSGNAGATYHVYDGANWTNTLIPAVLDDDVAVVATVTNGPSATQVEFSFSSANGDAKFGPIAVASGGEIQHVGYAGSGEVAALTGALVIGVEIKIDDVDIQINDVDARRFEKSKGSYATVGDFLKADAKTAFTGWQGSETLKVAEAYALGLVAARGDAMVPVNGGKLEIKADAQANVAEGIPLLFQGGVTPRTDTGTAVTYQLKGSADGVDWKVLGEVSTPSIPLSSVGAANRYFKVVTTLSTKQGGQE